MFLGGEVVSAFVQFDVMICVRLSCFVLKNHPASSLPSTFPVILLCLSLLHPFCHVHENRTNCTTYNFYTIPGILSVLIPHSMIGRKSGKIDERACARVSTRKGNSNQLATDRKRCKYICCEGMLVLHPLPTLPVLQRQVELVSAARAAGVMCPNAYFT